MPRSMTSSATWRRRLLAVPAGRGDGFHLWLAGAGQLPCVPWLPGLGPVPAALTTEAAASRNGKEKRPVKRTGRFLSHPPLSIREMARGPHREALRVKGSVRCISSYGSNFVVHAVMKAEPCADGCFPSGGLGRRRKRRWFATQRRRVLDEAPGVPLVQWGYLLSE